MSNIRTQIGKVVGKTLNSYHSRVKPKIDELKFKEQYQGRIIDCMVGEVDDNYIETPETDSSIVKLEHSKEGLVKVPSIKGKTILVDEDGNETDTPREGCRLVSVGEEEDNKLIILSRNYNFELGTFGNSIDVKYVAKPATNRIRTENLIDVKPNNTYIVTCSEGYEITTGMFDANNICKQNHPRTQKRLVIIPNTDIVKMGIIVRKIDNSDLTVDDVLKANIQIEGDLKHNKTEILLDEPLRRINNNVFDEIVGNKLIRRVGMLYVDGTNDSLYNLTVASHQNIENLQGFDIRLKNNLIVSQPLKCNNVNYVDNRCDEIWVHNGKGNVIVLRVPKEDLVSCDIVGLKEWLKNNPITIFYKLAEPIIEELPNAITLQGFDDTTMYLENSIAPTVTYGYNALIPYKEELKTQQQEVETNTLDIENNIIPYLMDMEFNLILMEDK